MTWFVWLLMLLYVMALLRAAMLWSAKDHYRERSVPPLSVSLIIPFRNEEDRLEALVTSLSALQYAQLEILLVNDHSTDQSLQKLRGLSEKIPFPTQVLDLQQGEGKKAALQFGIAQATGEVILTTDADCQFHPDWVSEMVKPFENAQVKMVSGPVALKGTGLFQRWQAMEFATLITIGALGIRLGKPTMANGANLAYRKAVFEEVKGFEGIDQSPSGDDELLLMKVNQAYPAAVVFRKSQAALVTTAAQKSWYELKQQRLRWASKWSLGKRTATRLAALFVFIINLSWLLLPLLAYLDWVNAETPIRIYSLRFVTEAIWVMVLSRFFPGAISVRGMIIHQYLYPLYVVYFGLMANFGNYQWKDRSYTVRVQ